ncbi:MAG: hypothetical protein AD742_07695 [Methylibium sp. NZG]|nr:MAG: hypothetical protein AD742_07695 [Methylibium sp. NZG]
MKTYEIEIQRLKAIGHADGLVEAQIDALVQPSPRNADGAAPTTVLRMTEANARVLQALLKTQLTELDKRKARSQR